MWQPVPTWFERLKNAGVSARAVLAAMFIGSGLTEAAYRGAEFHPASPTDDYARLLADELRAAPGLVYGYTAELDTAAHVFGIGSDQWHTAATNVDALLSRLLDTLPANTAVLVTADLPVSEAVRRAEEGRARGLIVVDGYGNPTGVVNEAAVAATPLDRRPWVAIGTLSRGVARADFVPAQLRGEALIKQLQESPASEYVVVEPDGQVLGVLAATDVAAALQG